MQKPLGRFDTGLASAQFLSKASANINIASISLLIVVLLFQPFAMSPSSKAKGLLTDHLALYNLQ